MKTKIFALAIALPLALAWEGPGSLAAQQPAQVGQQDTAQVGQRGRMRAAGRRGRAQAARRQGAGLHVGMDAGHLGPRMLLGLKDELALSEEQVGQLEKIHEDHHPLMQAQMQNLRGLQESLREARSQRDWDTLNQKIDEASNLRTGMAKGLVNVEKQAWEVLNNEQREKTATWQEGARLFQRQRMRGRDEMGQQGMGMQHRLRMHADSAQSR